MGMLKNQSKRPNIQKTKVLEKQVEGNWGIVQKNAPASFRSKGPSKMDEPRSTSRCICMKFYTLEDNKKSLHIPKKEKKGSHIRDEESQSFQTSHHQHRKLEDNYFCFQNLRGSKMTNQNSLPSQTIHVIVKQTFSFSDVKSLQKYTSLEPFLRYLLEDTL